MKPEFESYRAGAKAGTPTSIKLPPELQRKLGLVADVEKDSLTGLLIEGAVRVLQDRQNDPEFPAQVESHMQDLQATLGELTMMSETRKQAEQP